MITYRCFDRKGYIYIYVQQDSITTPAAAALMRRFDTKMIQLGLAPNK